MHAPYVDHVLVRYFFPHACERKHIIIWWTSAKNILQITTYLFSPPTFSYDCEVSIYNKYNQKRKINTAILHGKNAIVVFKTNAWTYDSFETTIHIEKYPSVYVFSPDIYKRAGIKENNKPRAKRDCFL
jgi:hypothetical protein